MRKYFIMRHHIFLSIICMIITTRCIQVIFAIIDNPHASSYLLIPGGQRTSAISQTWHNRVWQEKDKPTEPFTIQQTLLQSFHDNCEYGKGKCIAFPYQKLIASIARLHTIQYIGKEADLSQAHTISNRLFTITTLDPHRSSIYSFAVLMWPAPKRSYSPMTKKEQDLTTITRSNTIIIGEQWIRMTCDMGKIQAIKSLSSSAFMTAVSIKDPHYREPCPDYRLPQMLAFDYYHYLDDYEKAIDYYKIAAMHDDVPTIALSMPAIIARQYGIITSYR